MSASHLIACFLSAAGLAAAAAGDLPRPEGRVSCGPAAEVRSVGASASFVTIGWLCPPVESTSVGRMSEMSGAGLDLATASQDDPGRLEDNLRRLDLARAAGMRCIIRDDRMPWSEALATPEGQALLDTIVSRYRGHPGLFGYSLGDEPVEKDFANLKKVHEAFRARDPEHPAWNNLLGRAAFPSRAAWERYVRGYLESTGAAVLCDDQYDFRRDGDAGLFVENAAGLAAIARERGIPFWAVVLLVTHGNYRVLTPGELEWQASMLLAYGARGIGYFTYWTPAPDPVWNFQPAVIDREGRRTRWYGVLARLNRRVRAAGEALAELTWLGTVQAGSVPAGGTRFVPDDWVRAVSGRAALGHFVARDGTPFILVANSDSASSRTIALTLGRFRRVCVLDSASGGWADARCSSIPGYSRLRLSLGAGGFALLRLEPPVPGGIAGGSAPDLAVDSTSREIQLRASRVAQHGYLEVLDARGQRVWERALEPGETKLTWRGDKDSGGPVPSGLYFVHLEDEAGFRVSRLEWSGGP